MVVETLWCPTLLLPRHCCCCCSPPLPTPTGLVLLMASGREGLEDSLEYVKYVVKYRPRAPVLLVTVDPQLARACAPW